MQAQRTPTTTTTTTTNQPCTGRLTTNQQTIALAVVKEEHVALLYLGHNARHNVVEMHVLADHLHVELAVLRVPCLDVLICASE